tara:strand:- start:88 stop:498 length:411 start_codon:yes stop_codon:yes gene_type:complete
MPYFIVLIVLLTSFKTIAINQDQLISENDLYNLFKNNLKKWNEDVIFLDKKKSMTKITNNNDVYSLKSIFKNGSITISPLYENNLVNKIIIEYDLKIYDDFLINLIFNHYKNLENNFLITIYNTSQKIKIKIEKYN